MRLISTVFLLFVFLLCSSGDTDKRLNQPVPLLANKTLDGRVIDADYYKGHVTVVSFMYIGCMGCMNEIPSLNKLTDQYRGNKQLQVICVARQMKDQMVMFNSNDTTSLFCKVRKVFGLDPIRYTIQPGCDDGPSKMIIAANGDVQIKSECTTLEEKFGLDSYPTMYYVDKKGLVRYIEHGGPAKKDDTAFYNEIKKTVDVLLAE